VTVHLIEEAGRKLCALDVVSRTVTRELALEGIPNGVVYETCCRPADEAPRTCARGFGTLSLRT
jgi:hypothetical protein